MATIGQVLTAPETGWRGYDDTDSRIIYDGVPAFTNDPYCRNYTAHYVNSLVGSINFKFYGSKIRVIIGASPAWSNNVQITIDGVNYNYSNYNGALVRQILVFEKLDLFMGIHTVTIQNISPGYWGIDAIDIDDTGYLVNPIPVVKLLVQDGSLLKTISSGNLVTVCNTTDSDTIIENAFNTSGLSDLSLWNDSLTNQIVNSTFDIVAYRKYVE